MGQENPEDKNQVFGWADAIIDAERQIAKTKFRLARLKAALKWCQERLADGDPFPGESAENAEPDRK